MRIVYIIVTKQYNKAVASYYRFAAKSVLHKCISQASLALCLEHSLDLCDSFILYHIGLSVVMGETAMSYRLELLSS